MIAIFKTVISTYIFCITANALATVTDYRDYSPTPTERSREHLQRSIEFAETKFTQAYGHPPWISNSKQSFDSGRSVLNFIEQLSNLLKKEKINEALKLTENIRDFPASGVWCLPVKFRQQIEIDPSKINISKTINSIAESSGAWDNVSPAHAGHHGRYAIWPEFVIKTTNGLIALNDTENGQFTDLKLAYVLMVAEELAHTVQSHQDNYMFVALSKFMKNQGKSHLPPFLQWTFGEFRNNLKKATVWFEEDVYAYLIETFGTNLVPKYFANHYPEERKNVFDYFYSSSRPEGSPCSLALTRYPQQMTIDVVE